MPCLYDTKFDMIYSMETKTKKLLCYVVITTVCCSRKKTPDKIPAKKESEEEVVACCFVEREVNFSTKNGGKRGVPNICRYWA